MKEVWKELFGEVDLESVFALGFLIFMIIFFLVSILSVL
jgi:hypothetical protein